MAQVDYYLKIDGVDGESTDKDHKGEIELVSWSWRHQRRLVASGGGGGTGKVQLHDFDFIQKVDKASAALLANVPPASTSRRQARLPQGRQGPEGHS